MARQIRENTVAVASNTQQAHLDAWNVLSDLVIENSDVAELIRKSEQTDPSFDESERIRFEWLATKLFALYESVHADVTSGLLESAIAGAYERYYFDILCKPGFRGFWESHRSWYSQQFVAHVDQKLGATSSAN
jgi:hypothetical protein